MVEAIIAVSIGIKLSIFAIILVYTLLTNSISKTSKAYGLTFFALCFMVVAGLEFYEAVVHEGQLHLDQEEEIASAGYVADHPEEEHGEDIHHILSDVFTILAGFGLLAFIWQAQKSPENYR